MPPSLNRPLNWILGLALVAFVAGLCFNPAECNDLFWQIRAGHDIALSGAAPHMDAYSWTRRGAPWVVHEWLCFLLIWSLFQTGGFAALWIAEACMVVLTFLVVYVHTLRETQSSPIASFLLAIGSAIVACGFFQPRPHLWTYLFLSIVIVVLTRIRRSENSRRSVWLLAPVFLLWSNVHAGVIVGVGVVFAFALGDAIEAWISPAEREALLMRAARTALLGLGCAATTFATPYGWRIYENMGATLGNVTMQNIVAEWASPNFHDSDGKALEAFIALLAYGVAFTRRKREAAPLLILALLVHEALASSRNAPLLAIVGVMLFAADIHSSLTRHLSGNGDSQTSLFGRAPSLVSVVAVTAAIVCASAMRVATVLKTDGREGMATLPRIASDTYELASFPAAACRFMEAEKFPDSMKMYNIYDIGGYLIWRLPRRPVFIDGRADVYFGKPLEDVSKIYGLPYGWRALFDSYGIDAIFTMAAQQQTRVYLAAPDWALVYADRPKLSGEGQSKPSRVNAMIFVKRLPQYRDLIARCRKDCPAIAAMQSAPGSSVYGSLR